MINTVLYKQGEMLKGRQLKNDFVIELNLCFENETDGVYYTLQRFKQYLLTLQKRIEDDNQKIWEGIQRESPEVAHSMLYNEITQNQLQFFSDMLLQSTIVAIYSYFDIKLAEFARICEKYRDKKCNHNKSLSDIENHHSFLFNEIVSEIPNIEQLFKKILKWKDLRLFLVHKNENKFKRIDTDFFHSMKIHESGILFIGNGDILNFLDLINGYLNSIVNSVNEKYDLVEYHIVGSK